jgi:hypothetical protein
LQQVSEEGNARGPWDPAVLATLSLFVITKARRPAAVFGPEIRVNRSVGNPDNQTIQNEVSFVVFGDGTAVDWNDSSVCCVAGATRFSGYRTSNDGGSPLPTMEFSPLLLAAISLVTLRWRSTLKVTSTPRPRGHGDTFRSRGGEIDANPDTLFARSTDGNVTFSSNTRLLTISFDIPPLNPNVDPVATP